MRRLILNVPYPRGPADYQQPYIPPQMEPLLIVDRRRAFHREYRERFRRDVRRYRWRRRYRVRMSPPPPPDSPIVYSPPPVAAASTLPVMSPYVNLPAMSDAESFHTPVGPPLEYSPREVVQISSSTSSNAFAEPFHELGPFVPAFADDSAPEAAGPIQFNPFSTPPVSQYRQARLSGTVFAQGAVARMRRFRPGSPENEYIDFPLRLRQGTQTLADSSLGVNVPAFNTVYDLPQSQFTMQAMVAERDLPVVRNTQLNRLLE